MLPSVGFCDTCGITRSTKGRYRRGSAASTLASSEFSYKMHAFPESLLLFGVGLMNLMLAFGLAAIRTKPAAADNTAVEDEPALGVTPEPS